MPVLLTVQYVWVSQLLTTVVPIICFLGAFLYLAKLLSEAFSPHQNGLGFTLLRVIGALLIVAYMHNLSAREFGTVEGTIGYLLEIFDLVFASFLCWKFAKKCWFE